MLWPSGRRLLLVLWVGAAEQSPAAQLSRGAGNQSLRRPRPLNLQDSVLERAEDEVQQSARKSPSVFGHVLS